MGDIVVIGTVLCAWKCDGTETEWLEKLDELAADARRCGLQPVWFVAFETDARGHAPMSRVESWLERAGVEWTAWTYGLDDGEDEINSGNRLVRICMGRNLVVEYAMRRRAKWILFLDSDTRPDPASFSKLLELDWPVCGGDVPNYGLTGPTVDGYPFPVQQHWNTAGYLLVREDLFRKVAWGTDLPGGITDDPHYQHQLERLGWPTRVRKDCRGRHEHLAPVEHRDGDRMVRR